MEGRIHGLRGENITPEASVRRWELESTHEEASDRKTKKRVQNRVAQRLYRQRMKARMQELQAKVQSHEQMVHESDLNARATIYHVVNPNSSSNYAPSGDSHVPSVAQWTPPAHDHMVQDLLATGPQQPYQATTTHPQEASKVGINRSYDEDNDDGGGIRDNDCGNNRSRCRDARSKGSMNESQSSNTTSSTSSFDEMLQAQAQAQKQEDAMRRSVAARGVHQTRVSKSVPNATSRGSTQPDFAPRVRQCTQPNLSNDPLVNVDIFDVNTDSNAWDIELGMMDAFTFPDMDKIALPTHDFEKTIPLSTPLASRSSGENSLTQMSGIVTQNSQLVGNDCNPGDPFIDPSSQELQSWVASSSRIPGSDAPLKDRLQYVIERVTAVGFDDLESAMKTYYTVSFSDSSSLYSSQRVSRNRRLPRVLANIRAAAEGWTEWEQRGFREEMLKGAEDVLVEERNTFRRDVWFRKGCKDTYTTPDVKRVLQEGLPNLWTLLSALSAENRALRPHDRSRAVFCAIATLCCSGNIQEAGLTSWLQQCSEEVKRPRT